jgi:hypothetical protein
MEQPLLVVVEPEEEDIATALTVDANLQLA